MPSNGSPVVAASAPSGTTSLRRKPTATVQWLPRARVDEGGARRGAVPEEAGTAPGQFLWTGCPRSAVHPAVALAEFHQSLAEPCDLFPRQRGDGAQHELRDLRGVL